MNADGMQDLSAQVSSKYGFTEVSQDDFYARIGPMNVCLCDGPGRNVTLFETPGRQVVGARIGSGHLDPVFFMPKAGGAQ